jgi:tetrahydromethanopterin S-methyltransferase subunit G
MWQEMVEEKETNELEERLLKVERNLEQVLNNQNSYKRPIWMKFGIGCLAVFAGFFLFLVLIGIFRFISAQ